MVVSIAAVAVTAAYGAIPVTITSATHVDGHAKVTWTLPPGWTPNVIAIASKPDVGSDGSFFTENLVDGGILRAGQTEFLSSSRLEPRTYFVRLQAYADDFSDSGWTDTATFTISPAPPPGPANRRPSISNVRWSMVGHNPGPHYYVTVTVRFRVCDDRRGALTLRRTERQSLGGNTTATAAGGALRRLSGQCMATTWTWRLARKFFGIGNYTVRLWVTDAKGAKSNLATRNWYTAD